MLQKGRLIMETYDVIYYICSRKKGKYKIIADTNYLKGAKDIVKELRENYPKEEFFITVRLKDEHPDYEKWFRETYCNE